jgi:hypothetical protein
MQGITMSQAILSMTAELEDNNANEEEACNQEEAFKEDFDYPEDGALHWLPLMLPGVCKARAQAVVVGYGRHTDSLLRGFVHWI